jgi:hypothetical protein
VILRVGDTGHAVGELHQALLERGLSVDASDLERETYGASTLAAVEAFQRGAKITADGIAGPQTLAALQRPPERESLIAPEWRCEPSQVREAVRLAIQSAVDDLSRPTLEQPAGSNRGPHVDRYGVPGLPWCAAAVSAWVMRADGHQLRRPLMSAYKWREAAKAAGWLLGPFGKPQPGDVGIVLRSNLRGHVGLVVHVLDDGRLCSIEGNVGHAVRGVVRPRSAWGFFARPIPITISKGVDENGRTL